MDNVVVVVVRPSPCRSPLFLPKNNSKKGLHMPKIRPLNKHVTIGRGNKCGRRKYKCKRWVWWGETRGRWGAWSQGGDMEWARGQTRTIQLKKKLKNSYRFSKLNTPWGQWWWVVGTGIPWGFTLLSS